MDVSNSNPRDGLTNEQMTPYIARVLRQPGCNWMVRETWTPPAGNMGDLSSRNRTRYRPVGWIIGVVSTSIKRYLVGSNPRFNENLRFVFFLRPWVLLGRIWVTVKWAALCRTMSHSFLAGCACRCYGFDRHRRRGVWTAVGTEDQFHFLGRVMLAEEWRQPCMRVRTQGLVPFVYFFNSIFTFSPFLFYFSSLSLVACSHSV